MFSREAAESANRSSLEDQPDQAKGDPPAEMSEGSPLNGLPEVHKSHIYLVEEDKPDLCYRILVDMQTKGIPGLCVTRLYPDILIQKYDLSNCTIVWLSNAGKDDIIRPRDLERLSFMLEQFLSNEQGVVLIDGIEYLITNNDFVTVLRLIQSIRDQVAVNKAIMIISLNPSTLGNQELNLLEREMDSVFRFHTSKSDSQQDFQGR
jgi:hypothetical protein